MCDLSAPWPHIGRVHTKVKRLANSCRCMGLAYGFGRINRIGDVLILSDPLYLYSPLPGCL